MVPPGGAPPQQSPGGGSHVDWKRLDKARREVGPVHLDLIEHYASGKVSRRNFIRRGTIIGLSMPVIGAVIAACGGDDDGGDSGSSTTAAGGGASTTAGGATTSAAPGTTGAGQAGGTIRIGATGPVDLDPIQMQDLGSYGVVAQTFEFLVELGRGRRAGARPRRVVGAQRRRHGLDLPAARGVSGRTARTSPRPTWRRRWTASSSPRTPASQGVIAEGAVDTTDPNSAVFNARGARTATSRRWSPVQRPDADHAGQLRDRHDARPGEERHRAVEVRHVRRRHRRARSSATRTGGAGRRRSTARRSRSSPSSAPWSRPSKGGAADAIVQFSVIGGDALLNDPNFNVLEVEATTHRQIWMGTTTGPVRRARRARQALAYTFDREQMLNTLFQGRAVIANDHVLAPFFPMFFNEGAVEQRVKDVQQARAAAHRRRRRGPFSAMLHAVDLQEIPQLAQLIQSNAAEAGIQLELAVESGDTFYGTQLVPGRRRPAVLRVPPSWASSTTATGRRPTSSSTPPCRRAASGTRRSTHNPESFDDRLQGTRRRSASRRRPSGRRRWRRSSTRTCRSGCRSSTTTCRVTPSTFQGVRVSALGQMFVDKASQV